MVADSVYKEIEKHVLSKLGGLSPDLYYHNIAHTLDVVKSSERIARLEGGFSEKEIQLLRIAALFHDAGFLHTYREHEEQSCRIAVEDLPQFGLQHSDLECIKGLIRSTRIPQTPLNKLEEIICDADLDYLGRDDFFTISSRLFKELECRNFVENEQEWNNVQIRFLSDHRYFTGSSHQSHEEKKLQHLLRIRESESTVNK